MSTQIQFRAGHPQKFIATRSFSLGNSGLNISQGSELDFDGTNVSYEGSHPVAMPQLRGAAKAGWIVPAKAYDPNDLSSSIPRSAGMQIRNAQGGNPMDPPSRTAVTTADAEEREVGNVSAHARGVKDRNTNYRPGQRVNVSSVEAQEGVEVRKLSTPTRWETNLEKTTPGEAISQAKSVRIQPGEGRSREDVMAEMDEETREEYIADIEARRSALSAGEHPEALRERQANEARLEARRVVGRVAAPQNAQKEGFNITNSVGGGTEIADVSGFGGAIVESVTESEGMVFRNTNVGKPKPQVKPVVAASSAAEMDTRRLIARSICPDFPDNYVFDDPVRKKIARLQADFEDRPDVIKAVAAADTDLEVRQRLVEEFPEAFV